jgi:hypothetical protein
MDVLLASNYTRVTLVVDSEFGQRTKSQALVGPLWVIKSEQNVAAVKEVWDSGKSPFLGSPPYFDAVPGRSSEDAAMYSIGTLHDHHPAWRTFEVIGTGLTAKLLDAMLECAPGVAEETEQGFIFTRD